MLLEAIKYDKEERKLEILDQTQLPWATHYIEVKNVEDGWNVIKKMQVRGAPAIAIVGCLSLVVEIVHHWGGYKEKETFFQYIEIKLYYLVTARPTAVNMQIAAEKLTKLAKHMCDNETYDLLYMKCRMIHEIEEMLNNDVEANKTIGAFGATEIKRFTGVSKKGTIRILTHCNTGCLATAGYGTALGVIRSLHVSRELEHVYCTETRPYNQGARLTAYELVHDKIPATLICDDMVAAVLKTKKITAVVVGADRITANGDTGNKIGTYQIAILAKYHNVPFYVAAPTTSIDMDIPNGHDIIIEERPEKEITHMNEERIAAEGIKCWNPAFDVTPASLITAIITEVGIFKPHELEVVKKIRADAQVE
ncbi:methylthioribose-1-phosphate isomerase isoform X1 [Cataglyphis hispanica]|uniref:methylthioribose-1-phosphate isomerase isoform X1 n=1 Tax=Cataglyphis hispanica TaxID=1086592 RepID=UPI00217F43F0|nr:methylthioribose-1-phosphate isomerase isoform X1 [Cataglyphis hispanica]